MSRGPHYTFVEIDIIPPLHSHDITEPHVSDLVSRNGSDPLLSSQVRLLRIDQESARSTGDQSLEDVRRRAEPKTPRQLPSFP